MLTYREYENREAERQRAEKEAEKEAEELQRKNATETAYQVALNTAGIEALIQYINTFRYRDYFNKDSHAEIARRLTNNQNIIFIRISEIVNPYAFDKDAIYYYGGYRYSMDYIEVNQWRTDGSLLCSLGGDVLIIDKVPDITKIGKFIGNAYLQYKGTSEVRFVSGRNEMIAVFDLLFHF
jgi:hypothetical protein